MDEFWNYSNANITDTTYEYAQRSDYESSQFWGTFPSTSVGFFHELRI